ncbi:MAG: signal peptidase II [Chlamydiota bacterium]
MSEQPKAGVNSKTSWRYRRNRPQRTLQLALSSKRLIVFALIASLLFAADFFSKTWVNHYFSRDLSASTQYPYGGIGVFHQILGVDFCINRVTNRGGAWGVFASYSYLLLTVRLTIITALFIHTLFFNQLRARDCSFFLLITGAAGNLFDFFFYGYVIDFLHLTLWGYSFPVFNFADVMIFFGVALLLIQSLRKKDGRLSVPDQSAL